MIKHKFDQTGSAFKLGNNAETLFKEILNKKKISFIEATRKEQFSHIDFFLTLNNKQVAFEVKGLKKVSRQDEKPNNTLIWIELVAVNGLLGWLYGSANKIAFQHDEKSFVLVDRLELVQFVEKNLKQEYVKSPDLALHKLYKRWNREDLLTLITKEELLSLPHEILL